MAAKLICVALLAACLLQVLDARSIQLDPMEVAPQQGPAVEVSQGTRLPVSGVFLLLTAERGARARPSVLGARLLDEPVFADIPPVPIAPAGRDPQN